MPSVLTPKATGPAVGKAKSLVFWKQIVPTTRIHYTDPATKRVHALAFDDPRYHEDLKGAFKNRLGPDSVAFQLADSKNGHGRDLSPEAQRGVVTDLATLEELPPKTRAKVEAVARERGTNPQGTYAKIRMFDEDAATAVHNNADLSVSARIREGFTRGDGVYVPRAVIHVCGTYDSQVVGMSPWTEADLAVYPDEDGATLDLSNTTYQEAAPVPKNKDKNQNAPGGSATMTADLDLSDLTDDELAEWAESLGVTLGGNGDGGSGGDSDDDGDDPNSGDPNGAGQQRQLVGAGAPAGSGGGGTSDLSVTHNLAVAANERADEALRQLADQTWAVEREALVGQGVPPAAVDLCAPYLSSPGGFVVDLSNSDGATVEQDVAGDFRKLLGFLGGYVDLANEAGHGGQFKEMNDADPDQPMLDQWESQFPL